MKTVYACGKRGFGDLVCGISYIIDSIKEDTHIIFFYRPYHQYEEKIPAILEEYLPLKDFKVTYEINHDWYSVSYEVCKKKFNYLREDDDWFFISANGGILRPFNTQWKEDKNGPIGLCLNNENTNIHYPMPGKWFDPKVNDLLTTLIDEKNYVTFGRMFSIQENIQKLARCRYVVGVDGAWAHICNALRAPYYLSTNRYDKNHYQVFFRKHPTLTYIKQEQVLEYCIL